MRYEVDATWVHLQYAQNTTFVETYGFSGSQGNVNLEALLLRPRGIASRTLLVYMHPTSTLQLLPVPREMAARGAHVLCAASRYAKNDTALIFENVLLDLAAYIRHAKEVWEYDKIVLIGWSGGGSLMLFYQSQAEHPTITDTPAGDPVNIVGARLIPADAVIFQAAHLSRAQVLLDWIDPSVVDELRPDARDPKLDLYDPKSANRPPYGEAFLEVYRRAQRARMSQITVWVKQTLADLRSRGTVELERGFVTHRTMADPRFLDPAVDPNDRRPGWSYMGHPETVNTGPIGLARFSTLRSWLSQWSIDDSRADGLMCAEGVTVPFLAIENSADDAVPQPHTGMVYRAAGSGDKTFQCVLGATHYYVGQPEHLREATELVRAWLRDRDLYSLP